MILKFLSVFSAIICFSVCSVHAAESSCRPLKIVTSFSILKDFIEKITAGVNTLSINSIVPVEADPHTYQPTPHDSRTLAHADIIFINGLDFEKGIEKLIITSGFGGKLYTVSQGLKPRTQPLDPHLWHDVKNAKRYVKRMAEVLIRHDPVHQHIYHQNTVKLLERLDKLEAWVHQTFATIPLAQRLVVTTHDAFWYFGQAYQVQFLAPLGISTESEATAQNVSCLIKFIRMKKVKAVFVENLANPRLLQQIAEETKVPLQGVLYADSLSAPDGPAADYEAMIRHNTLTIQRALQGAPLCKP